MCTRRPKPPKLPPPTPDPSAMEATAKSVIIGGKRTEDRRKKVASTTGRKRLGTASLQIPLLVNSMQQPNNLNYPM